MSSSAVKSTCCYCRGLHLDSPHSHSSSRLSELPFLGLLMPSSVVLMHCMPVVHIDTHRQNIHVHKVKISKCFFQKRKTQKQLPRANMTLLFIWKQNKLPTEGIMLDTHICINCTSTYKRSILGLSVLHIKWTRKKSKIWVCYSLGIGLLMMLSWNRFIDDAEEGSEFISSCCICVLSPTHHFVRQIKPVCGNTIEDK